ncbi:MAG TPA: hypothetical protein VFQ68_31805 [Streptosporangiaceae bacterium]|nr:hypothetical protein [Streptosporangiaceae bacterium]
MDHPLAMDAEARRRAGYATVDALVARLADPEGDPVLRRAGAARLRGRNGEVRRRPRAPATARAHRPLGRPPTTTDGENVMSNTDTDLLHDSIDRLTVGERLPAGLAARAFRRRRSCRR